MSMSRSSSLSLSSAHSSKAAEASIFVLPLLSSRNSGAANKSCLCRAWKFLLADTFLQTEHHRNEWPNSLQSDESVRTLSEEQSNEAIIVAERPMRSERRKREAERRRIILVASLRGIKLVALLIASLIALRHNIRRFAPRSEHNTRGDNHRFNLLLASLLVASLLVASLLLRKCAPALIVRAHDTSPVHQIMRDREVGCVFRVKKQTVVARSARHYYDS